MNHPVAGDLALVLHSVTNVDIVLRWNLTFKAVKKLASAKAAVAPCLQATGSSRI